MEYSGDADLPDRQIDRVAMLEGIMTAAATGGGNDEPTYSVLRSELMSDPAIRSRLPTFVTRFRRLAAFWPWIREENPSYAGRRQLISEAFTPLMDWLERPDEAPGDAVVTEALAEFDELAVRALWERALARRATDPEGAITMARTLLETTCKRILDELNKPYTNKEDLPKLYALVATELNLAPSQHTAEPVRAILGAATNLVNGIGTLRNRMSDSHGRGGKLPVRPSARHADLAVNAAGAVATFLVETYQARKDGSDA